MTIPLASLSTSAHEFLQAVGEGLADLPPEDRADLLGQVEQRLRDIDVTGDGGDIETQLGPATAMTRELRAAAGFPTAPAAAERDTTILDTLRAVLDHRGVRPVLDYLASLRPAWWALRGYLLVAGVLAGITGGGGYGLHTLGSYAAATSDRQPAQRSAVWLAIPVAAVVVSVVAGRVRSRLPRSAQMVLLALNIAAVVLLLAYPTWWLAPAFATFSGLVN